MSEPNLKTCVGWREWVSFPTLKLKDIKAKIDTGARTSALHADEIEYFKKAGKEWVRFVFHPKESGKPIKSKAEVVTKKWIKSSQGHKTNRPVIVTDVLIGTERWPIELTLVNRDMMGFRLLIGRQAVRRRFLVDPARSFLKSGKKFRIKASRV